MILMRNRSNIPKSTIGKLQKDAHSLGLHLVIGNTGKYVLKPKFFRKKGYERLSVQGIAIQRERDGRFIKGIDGVVSENGNKSTYRCILSLKETENFLNEYRKKGDMYGRSRM